MRFEVVSVRIEFMDGEVRTVNDVGGFARAVIRDDCLFLMYKGGEMADVEDRGAFPLVNIRTWEPKAR